MLFLTGVARPQLEMVGIAERAGYYESLEGSLPTLSSDRARSEARDFIKNLSYEAFMRYLG